ncbi:hypothetical protein ACBY01_15085 [Sphingomonas sp. ac-8]|uniref:hypothetical protein n=1 Tax=Sphingomonas sp. ac-8 TaxID=3242977 RepID=UPI003A7FC731
MISGDRAIDLPLGRLCRIGFLLCVSFWVPLGLILGVVDMCGAGTMTWGSQQVPRLLAVPAGMAGGFIAALLNDALLAIGAVVLVTVRTLARRFRR